jgi:hypothetical protein
VRSIIYEILDAYSINSKCRAAASLYFFTTLLVFLEEGLPLFLSDKFTTKPLPVAKRKSRFSLMRGSMFTTSHNLLERVFNIIYRHRKGVTTWGAPHGGHKAVVD